MIASVSTIAAPFTPLLVQDAGAPLEIDLIAEGYQGGPLMGSFAFVVFGTSGGGADNAQFRVRLATTSGTTILGYGGGNFGLNFLAGGAIEIRTAALPVEASMVVAVDWGIAFESATATIDPAHGQFPSSARMNLMELTA